MLGPMAWSITALLFLHLVPLFVTARRFGHYVHLSPGDEDLIVQLHNDFRREVFAADMQELVCYLTLTVYVCIY
jgi:hypothetical protein